MYSEAVLEAVRQGATDEAEIVKWCTENQRGAMNEVLAGALLTRLEKDGAVKLIDGSYKVVERDAVVVDPVIRCSDLMKNGKWMISEKQRPAGWDKLPAVPVVAQSVVKVAGEIYHNTTGTWREVVETAGRLLAREILRVKLQAGADPNQYTGGLLRALSNDRHTKDSRWLVKPEQGGMLVERMTDQKAQPAVAEPARLVVFEKPVSKYRAILDELKELAIGDERKFPVPEGQEWKNYKRGLIPAVSNNTRTRMGKWLIEGTETEVTVKKVGVWPAPGTAVETVVTHEMETTHTVERRKVEQSVSQAPAAVEPPRPAQVKPEIPAAVCLPAKPRQKYTSVQPELVALVLKMYGPGDQLVDGEWDATFADLEKLSYRLQAERDAELEADVRMDLIGGETLAKEEFEVIWQEFHYVLTEKRMLEFKFVDACQKIRDQGDPAWADYWECILPDDDQERLKKEREQEKS